MTDCRREHPAYSDLVNTFKGSTASPNHLAFLALTGLDGAGWAIIPKEALMGFACNAAIDAYPCPHCAHYEEP